MDSAVIIITFDATCRRNIVIASLLSSFLSMIFCGSSTNKADFSQAGTTFGILKASWKAITVALTASYSLYFEIVY